MFKNALASTNAIFSALEIPGRTFPVEQIFLEDCLDITGIIFFIFFSIDYLFPILFSLLCSAFSYLTTVGYTGRKQIIQVLKMFFQFLWFWNPRW